MRSSRNGQTLVSHAAARAPLLSRPVVRRPRSPRGRARRRPWPGALARHRERLFVAKSENRNQVHYGVRLDETCAPTGRSPVFAYWRMLERGPLATEPLLSLEQPAYGVAGQRVLARGASGGQVEVQLNALRARTILVASSPRGQSEQAGQPGERCAAAATTTIGGAPAALTSVYAKLGWPFGVAYLTLSGRTLADGRAIRERIVP